jgi:hypothetical protein
MGGLALVIGLIADLISFNRQLAEMTLERVRRIDLRAEAAPKDSENDGHAGH